jgi:hypothetical protein
MVDVAATVYVLSHIMPVIIVIMLILFYVGFIVYIKFSDWWDKKTLAKRKNKGIQNK